ncbi:hypothetical protein AV521_44775 [Streptomyces sp. IMTB 2501]|uniref:hypothetical protein n=1 Tax=Streptomyces sp. IMTB 2501 TaxID=1776340 RepID=UPI00096D91C6|nr:hypothetical protein [Streptomyces sp. IMTB 2501]OLZ60734.1 hypothetical protein AV521_44775 [Streptomyces sp. IMTB 2501]
MLVNPTVEVTETMFDHASIIEYGYIAPGTDTRTLSPLYADNLNGPAPALRVVPTQDATADHGRRHAERLPTAGTSVRRTAFPGVRKTSYPRKDPRCARPGFH